MDRQLMDSLVQIHLTEGEIKKMKTILHTVCHVKYLEQ